MRQTLNNKKLLVDENSSLTATYSLFSVASFSITKDCFCDILGKISYFFMRNQYKQTCHWHKQLSEKRLAVHKISFTSALPQKLT